VAAKLAVSGGDDVVDSANVLADGADTTRVAARSSSCPLPTSARRRQAQLTLLLNQKELGELMDSSQRTVQRWYAGRGWPSPGQLTKLAVAVHPATPTSRVVWPRPWVRRSRASVSWPGPPSARPGAGRTVAAHAAPRRVGGSCRGGGARRVAAGGSPRRPRAVERAKAAALTLDDLLAVLRPPGKRGAREMRRYLPGEPPPMASILRMGVATGG